MAGRIESCNWCGSSVRVPFEAQAFSCRVCRGQTVLCPYNNNNGYANSAVYWNNGCPPSSNNGYANPGAGWSNGNGYGNGVPYNKVSAYNNPMPGYGNAQQCFPVNGRKRAVLCGLSYYGQRASLKGSANNINYMRYFLVQRMGFPAESIFVLTENEKNPSRIPTRHNILGALRWLIQGCRSGDSLVFYYSGHGSRVPDLDRDEADGFDEALCPVDYKHAGMILDDEINDTIVKPLPHGAKLHAIIDTCYSGTMLDLPFVCRMNREQYCKWEDHRTHVYKGTSGGKAYCFSACDDQQNSADTTAFSSNITIGAFTYSFIKAVENEPQLTYGSLLNSMHNKILEAQKEVRLSNPNAVLTPQEPLLSSTARIEIHSKTFTL